MENLSAGGWHHDSNGVTTKQTASKEAGRTRLGRWGESLAAAYLAGLGWQILDRNWRCRAGELDIVAHEPGPPPRLVVVEVKTKAGAGFGDPLEAITAAKLHRLGQLGLWWQASHPEIPGHLRLDAVGITKVRGQAPVLRHVRGAA